MRISDWSSDVCSSDLVRHHRCNLDDRVAVGVEPGHLQVDPDQPAVACAIACHVCPCCRIQRNIIALRQRATCSGQRRVPATAAEPVGQPPAGFVARSEEHTSELQSLMSISYAVFSLKKKNVTQANNTHPEA